MGDLLGNHRIAPPPFCVSRACSFGGAGWFPHPAAPILGVEANAPKRATEQSSTGMGDLLGNPRVAPPPFCVSRACSFGGAGWFPHPAAPILGVVAKAPKRSPEESSTGMGDLLGNPCVAPPPFCVSRACSFGGAGWFPHPAAPILGVAAKATKQAPEQNSVVKHALARVVLGWVTSWEILVLHLLLFASVGLVLLVAKE
ncbi:hypothetical protein VNO77_08285 [Canavalia gladiata]|uniref:Uncharacterized protein n=1 Tax=Canavalia gladiata TaxID=3824 RepID=A0AAN9QTR3_CANGL